MEKRASFSTNINQLICVGFGIAFLIIYVASSVLLFVSENDMSTYYVKAISMFLLYLLMYAICVWFTTRKITRMFEPLDQIAYALMEDKIQIYGDEDDILEFANGLKHQMEKMERLSLELESTKGSLKDFYEESRQNRQEYDSSLDKCRQNAAASLKKGEDILNQNHHNREIIQKMLEGEEKLKVSQNSLHETELSMEKSLKDIHFSTEDTREDFGHTQSAFSLLEDMLAETTSLIESLFTEITVVQGIASQANLYAMNASLDMARSGAFFGSATGSGVLEDIKELTRKITDKTDEISLLVIRIKNSTKLAMDQSAFCSERQEEASENFEVTGKKLSSLTVQIKSTTEAIHDIRSILGNITGGLYELDSYAEKQMQELSSWNESMRKLNKRLNLVQETMKNG